MSFIKWSHAGRTCVIIFLIEMTIFGSISWSVPADRCEQINSYLLAMKSGIQPIEAIASELANSNLIMIGESHSETDPTPYGKIMSILGEATKASPICLILEAKSPIGDFSEITPANLTNFSQLTCTECLIWKASVDLAFNLGWRVFAVDSILDGYPGADASVQLRDNVMGERIRRLWSSGLCKSGVALVGKRHLMTGSFELKRIDDSTVMTRKSLAKQIREFIEIKTVDFIKRPKDLGYDGYYSNQDFYCNERIRAVIPVNMGWQNAKDSRVPIYFNGPNQAESYSFTNEFDFTIMVQ